MAKAQAAAAESAPAEERTPYAVAIAQAKERFQQLNGAGLEYSAEALFALQSCQNNDYLARIASENPLSLRMAVANVAAIGLTLNPVFLFAFLVPRDGKVVLDIGYRGLIKIATDIGSIKWAKAELVYASDDFRYLGPAKEPDHVADVFATPEERGDLRGAYCIAKTADGDVLVEAMSASDIYKAREKSAAYSKSKSGPWVDFPGEQAKKTVIKRASKTWPKTDREQRLAEAIRILNEDNGEGLLELAEGRRDRSERPGKTVLTAPVGKIPPAEEVSARVVATVAEVVERARKSGVWAAALDYVNQKYKGSDLDYALGEIDKAKREATRAA